MSRSNKYSINPTTGGEIVRMPIPVEATNPTRLFPTTDAAAPIPVKPVKGKIHIPINLHNEDKKWLKGFLEE